MRKRPYRALTPEEVAEQGRRERDELRCEIKRLQEPEVVLTRAEELLGVTPGFLTYIYSKLPKKEG